MNYLSIIECYNDEVFPTDAFFVVHADHASNHHPAAIRRLMQRPASRLAVVLAGQRWCWGWLDRQASRGDATGRLQAMTLVRAVGKSHLFQHPFFKDNFVSGWPNPSPGQNYS